MSGNSRERRRQARALKQQQQQQQQQQQKRRHSPPPDVRVGAVAPPPSFRAVLLQDRDPVPVQPVAARLSSLQVGDLGASPSSNIVVVPGTSVETDGMASLRMIVGGSVSAAGAERVPPTDGFSPRTSTTLGTGSRSLQGNVASSDRAKSSVQGENLEALEASPPSTTVPPPPQAGGLHLSYPPLPEGGLHQHTGPHVRGLMESAAEGAALKGSALGGELLDPPSDGNHAPSSLDDTFISAQEILPESVGVWRTQRWEHHRLQQCRRLGRDSGPVVPLMERLSNMPEDTQTLGYGIRRTSIGTWVTTSEGQSAFYPRRAREYEEWDLDEDQNIRDPFPRHPSFDATVDEDDYFIDYTSCTSNFSFTAHPEDYEGCVIVPPTSVSIRRHVTSLEDDIRDAWPVAEESQQGDSAPAREDLPRLQRDTMAAIALTIDDVLAHILDIFARNRDLAARIVGARDEADSSILQLSGYVATTVTELKDCITQEFEDLRKHFDDELDTVADDFHDQVAELEKRMLALEHRVDKIPSTSPVPPLQAIRVSLASMERAATKRLSDHANSLMASLARRRVSRSRGNGGRSSGASGWSVASDSQLSVDAPADHGGDSPPLSIRGGGATIPLKTGMASTHSPAEAEPGVGVQVPPTSTGKSDVCALNDVDTTQQGDMASGVAMRSGGCFPTPWSANGNLFSARENAALAAALARDTLPSQTGTTLGPDVLPHSQSRARDAPDEVFMHGQYYARVPPPVGVRPVCDSPPGLGLGPSLLLPSTQKLTTLSKFWHGGGLASSYMTGVDALSLEQVVNLGVPPSMAFVVVSTHHQVYTQWMRLVERDQMGSRNGYGDFGSRGQGESMGRSYGPNPLHEAIKHTGWQELPRDGVTPEKWIEFYTTLQLIGNYFNIGIMPFEALDLRYADGGHSMCLCGLGYSFFSKMGTTLFLIIQKLLPVSVPEISTKIQSVALNGGNGFELLWILTKHFVPMISTTKHLGWPIWPQSEDIFLFARRVSLYCTLCRLRGMKPYTDAERSELFLSNIGGAHREYAQHLLTTLQFHVSSSADGSLPPHLKLSISDLTDRLTDRLRDDARGATLPGPMVNRVVTSSLPSVNVPFVLPMDSPHIQGYCVNVTKSRPSVSKRAPRPRPSAARDGSGPDTRVRRYEGNCAACGKWGHQAVQCHALGMAVYLKKYSADRTNQRAIKEAEQAWVEQNKKWVPTDIAPSKLLTRYCEVTKVPVDQVDEELDWDLLCLPHDSEQEDAGGVEMTARCNRVDDSPDGGTGGTPLSTSSSAWFPQSYRVGMSPLVPPGSVLDSMTVTQNGFIGELQDPALRSESDEDLDESDNGEDRHPVGEAGAAVNRLEMISSLVREFPITQTDVMTAFRWSEDEEAVTSDDTESSTAMHWSEALTAEMSRVFRAINGAPLPTLDLSHSLVVPEWEESTLPSTSVCRTGPVRVLVDSGSNVCLTNDLSILEGVQDMIPRALDVAVESSTTPNTGAMCTKFGFVPMRLLDGSIHRQKFLYNALASETILSPEDIIRCSPVLCHWVQSSGGGASGDGCLLFSAADGVTVLLSLSLFQHNGLYYCSLSNMPPDMDDLDGDPRDRDHDRDEDDGGPLRVNRVSRPVTGMEHLSSELWAARLGYCGSHQLNLIPSGSTGTPTKFRCHPFRFIDVKEDAAVKRQPCGRTSTPALENAAEFYMDFAFLRASSCDFGVTPPESPDDRIVQSFDGFNAHLVIVDKRSRRSWAFLRISKEPPTDIVDIFLKKYGRVEGGTIRCDQGGELARSEAFRKICLSNKYIVESTGADSPSQNGGVERWNGLLAVTVRALLYGAGLSARYWSAALTHAVYLHNRRVHMATRCTPYEMWHGSKPDLSHLRIFGSRVCVKKSGDRPAKLDNHAFHGIFIGYTATDKNIRYLDMDSGVVKSCHHAVFDEAWYTQPKRPPTAQLLYTLGLECDNDTMDVPTPTASKVNGAAKVVVEFDITHRDLRQVYFSPSPYMAAFEESINKRWFTKRKPQC